MSEIQPALTPEEWARFLAVLAETDHWTAYRCMSQDFHGLAALALHGQPFGFTWEDVVALREEVRGEWEGPGGTILGEPGHRLLSIAARIAALLPPEGV